MKLLHLVGSQTSDYYYGVSTLYAPGCIGALPDVDHVILLARLDGTWSVLSSLDDEKIVETAERLSLPKALVKILDEGKPDLMQPHMFCYQGMVTFRSIADMLDIPLLGSPGHVMALTTNKWQTRAVMESAGVPVPKAQLLQQGDGVDAFNMEPPFVLKPCREDNSMGISLVTSKDQIDGALAIAFTFDDQILCEQFIPLGREIRVGVVEGEDGKLEMLPTMEYILTGNCRQPIRTSADKLVSTTDDLETDHSKLSLAPTVRNIPAKNVDATLLNKLYELASKAHFALGCEHYSLYDVRIDPNNNPYFIEASPYCSFSPQSAIVVMSRGNPNYNDTDIFYRLARKAIENFIPICPSEMNAQDADGGATAPAVAMKTQQLGMRTRRTLQQRSQ